MKEQSLEVGFIPQIPTTPYTQVMNEQFIKAYNQALKFSNLQVDSDLKYRNITIYDNEHIHELYTVSRAKKPHLVMLHGYGGTALTFVRTFQHLKDFFQVHALDTFGVGLSSRGKWKENMTPQETGEYYIGALQQWRKNLGIESFVLAGHSFGGYISSLYLQKYPQRVSQLILLSPAGSGKISQELIEERARGSRLFFCLGEKIFNCGFRPSKIMNSWFFGNRFIEKILTNRLKLEEEQKSAWKQYLQEIIKIDTTSQSGFYTLFGWPLQPYRSIQQIFRKINPKIRIDFFFGDNDWMRPEGGKRLAQDYENIHFHIIKDSGHQMIFDNPEEVTSKIKQLSKV